MLRYAKNSDLGKWPEVTSPVVHNQCLPINFNIFSDKKYCATLLSKLSENCAVLGK